MPKTTWDDDEAQFLKQSVKEWELYSGSNQNVGSDNPLNAFISDLVNKFYQRFPDRDVDQQPKSNRLFTQERRNQLTKRVQKYLNNQRHVELKVTNTNKKIGNKTTTVRLLFKTYNKALALEWEVFQTNNQEGLERLKASAKGLRSDAQGGIDQQTPEMQKRMLDALPSEIAHTLDAWGRKYNMVSYIDLLAKLQAEPSRASL
ncbi:hypothetical protein BDV93DRAFT_514457 [Ceratobasidium sp. AG-I]|nr:hypothetical protein BDV93DRAFT_514457 [Ceratobasidium sp. AG-I]